MGIPNDWLNEVSAQQPQPAPPSPDQPGGYSPVVENAPQNQGGGLRGFLSGALKNFLSGAQESLRESSGVTANRLQEAQNAHLDAQTEMTKAQTQQMGQMVTVMTPSGPLQLPFALAQKALGPSLTGQYKVQGTQIGADSRENIADTVTQGKVDVARINQGQGVPVDATVADMVGMPEIAGQPAGKALWKNINSALSARGYKYQDLGNDGLWLVDRAGTKIKQMAAQGPSVARATAFASARAQWTPFETVDDAGQPTTISAAQAVKTGAPGIPKTNLTQVRGKQALIDDIRGGVQQVRDTSQVLDRPGVKVRVAALLADPGITTSVFAQSPLAGTMQPDEQQYVINLLNLKENAMAMRSVLGAGQGSEDLRSAITKTIPNAMTPDSKYANMQLDTFLKTLERLEKGIPQVTKPGSAPQIVRDKMNQSKTGLTIKRDSSGRIVGVE